MKEVEIRNRISFINSEIKAKEDSCLANSKSYDDFFNETKDLRKERFELEMELRLVEEPVLTGGKKWKGQMMSLEKFKEMCVNGEILEHAGTGYYCSANAKSNIEIHPTDVLFGKVRSDFENVLWVS